MARTLTIPQAHPDGIQQAITTIRFDIPHAPLAEVGAVGIQKDRVRVWYEVTTYDIDGALIDRQSAFASFADWPPNFLLDVKSMYGRLETHAESIGIFEGPGADEPLEP